MPTEDRAHPDRPAGRQGISPTNLVVGFGIRGGSLILGALTAAVIARLLNASGVVQALTAISVGTTIGVICQAGLPLTIAHRVARVRVGELSVLRLRMDLRAAMLYLLCLLFLFAAASIPSWPLDPSRLIPGGSETLFLAAVIVGGGRAASRVLSETNRGFGHVNLAGLGADLIGPSMGLAGVAALTWLTTEDVTAARVVWILAFGWCAATLFAAWWAPIRPALRPARGPARGDRLRNVIGVLGVVSILNAGIQQAHIIIAGLMLPTVAAAGFATAARLAPLAGTPLVLLSAIASPDIGVALQSKEPARARELEQRLQRITGLLLLLSLPLVGIFALAGSQVLTFLFGPAYAVGHQELVILSLGPLASLAAGVAGMCLIQAGRHRRVLLDTVVGSFVSLGLMLVGGMRAGSTGLAIGYALGQLTINLLLLRSCRLELGVMPYARPLEGLRWLNSVLRVRRRRATPS